MSSRSMSTIKPIIKRPLGEGNGNAAGPDPKVSNKKRKSVSFAQSPEKPSKRQAQAKHIATPRLNTSTQKPNRFTHPARYSEKAHLWPRLGITPNLIYKAVPGKIIKLPAWLSPKRTPDETSEPLSPQVAKIKPDDMFEPPTQPIQPFDPQKDWFTSMHVSIGCTANPVHVVGVKMNQDKRQCEGIEGLDYRLQSGQVKVLFHPNCGHEPVCETCWTIEHPEEAGELDLKIPGSWPKEPPEQKIHPKPSPHTHIFNVFYEGCKHGDTPGSPEPHCLKLVKGAEKYGGNGTMCLCHHAHSNSRRGREEGPAQLIATQVILPDFAGCPACEGKDLRAYVRRYQTSRAK
ncbi:hypothetical protein TWF106_000201 [Orbilia oligospora]|uniref:Uncharacterized protein n=2 Tax=Orbilia oligospora TaxID=2813651 RepID=A0A7C8V5L5_ORBOL|nr:hypothetical protein TWF106_000201 [Orbilia oligospora]